MFPEGKLARTDTPLTAETCLQTIHLLDGQLTVYTDGSASAGTKDGGAGVIVTRGDPADPTVLHQSHLRGAAFTSSFAEEAAAEESASSLTLGSWIQADVSGEKEERETAGKMSPL